MSGPCSAGSQRSRTFSHLTILVLLAVLLSLASVFSHAPTAHASGSGTILYIHTATAANTAGDYTLLDNGITNKNPNMVIVVTPNWNPHGVYNGVFDNHQVGVWYDSAASKWGIFNEDGTAMPVGASFNVFAGPTATFSWMFVVTASTSSYLTHINNPLLNGNPSASLLVTQNWSPGGSGGIYNNHAVGVWYDSAVGEWSIYNEDRSALPVGAAFNVINITWLVPQVKQVATAANTSGDSTCLSGYNSANWMLFVTHDYSGYFTDVAGVWYNAALNENCVFDGSSHAMPIGATFFVLLQPLT